jgi:hypothetical protein
MKNTVFFFIACAVMLSCRNNNKIVYADNNCKLVPPFVGRLGFNTRNALFSTSEKKAMGLVLIESADPLNPQAPVTRRFQDSSWKKAGWLAPIQLDEHGNIFTAPAPFINVLNNPATDQNTIYKVNGQTGHMGAFVKLPAPDSNTEQNPFGILGMVYLCETGSLYVSSVAGSNRRSEKGILYQVNAVTGKISAQLTGMDILGMGISYIDGERKLFLGRARSSEVYAVALDKKGNFSGKPVLAFSLEGLGPRGDDKVRRIKTNKDGSLDVYGMEFNFNLIAPTEKQETVFRFVYDEDAKKWIHKLAADSN